ncbi:MAG: hypothetical protein Q8L34_05750 [Candidatus Woesearchaeota archaeon]|nr:hypothetical protein [Candidatus Woesearchaeota archaeon]
MLQAPSFWQYYVFVALCVLLVIHLKKFNKRKRKWKSTAILLTFLFGGLSWFYTYRKNKKKCWFIAGLAVLTILFPVLISWKPEVFFEKLVYPLFGVSLAGQLLFKIISAIVVTLVAIPGFVWPLMHHLRLSSKFYENYYKS